MSIALVTRRKGHRHGYHDDLESVFWVLCYCLARYTNLYKGPDRALVASLNNCFDSARPASVQREGRPEAQKGGDGKRITLVDIHTGAGKSDFTPDGTHPAIKFLLTKLARSLHYFLQFRAAQQELQPFEPTPPKPEDKNFETYLNAKMAMAGVKVLEEWTFPFTHDNVAKTLDSARVQFQADKTEPSLTLHGSTMLRDRLKAYHEAERQKEKLEKEKAQSNRDKAEGRSQQSGGKGAGTSQQSQGKGSGSRKRSHSEADNGADDISNAAQVHRVSGTRKSARLANTSSASSRRGSSRREPPEPTVPEDDEPEED